MFSYGAPSVRMLGGNMARIANTETTTNAGSNTLQKSTSSTSVADKSRTGVLRAKPKTVTGSVANSDSSASRFPVVKSVSLFNMATAPKTQEVNSAGVDADAIINNVMNQVSSNYYNQAQIDNIISTLKPEDKDDVRVDMIRVSTDNPQSKWQDWIRDNSELYQKRLDQGYVFMWIEK